MHIYNKYMLTLKIEKKIMNVMPRGKIRKFWKERGLLGYVL